MAKKRKKKKAMLILEMKGIFILLTIITKDKVSEENSCFLFRHFIDI